MLFRSEAYLPIILEHEDGVRHGNDWARGFMRGMARRREGWNALLADDDHAGCIVPILMLYHEHDEDQSLRPAPIGPQQREEIIVHLTAGLLLAHRYFRRRGPAHSRTSTPASKTTRHGSRRNDPCPCGSGKKYKRCCGGSVE